MLAFELKFLDEVAKVKDTTTIKEVLMFHLVELVRKKFPSSSDLYSELPHVNRVVSKVCEGLTRVLIYKQQIYRTHSLLSACAYISTGRPCAPNNDVRLTADAHVMMLTIFYCCAY